MSSKFHYKQLKKSIFKNTNNIHVIFKNKLKNQGKIYSIVCIKDLSTVSIII